jgi:transcriptional regulator with XRE-family HTH domain
MAKGKKIAKKTKKSDNYSIQLKQLGDRIRSLRIQAGYTNYENFAFEHDIPRAQFGRYERGEDLRYSSLLKICEALDISVKVFFSEGFD